MLNDLKGFVCGVLVSINIIIILSKTKCDIQLTRPPTFLALVGGKTDLDSLIILTVSSASFILQRNKDKKISVFKF